MLHIANASYDKTHPKTMKEETIKRNDNPKAQPSPALGFQTQKSAHGNDDDNAQTDLNGRGEKEHQWLPVFCKK
jgi:hypothetical protein